MGRFIRRLGAKLFFFIPVRIVREILSWTLSILLCLTLLCGIILLCLDAVTKMAVEKIAPWVTGAPVSVESIAVKPFRGRVEIRNLVIGNPEKSSYASGYAVRLGDAALEADLSTLFKKKLVIREIKLKNVSVNFETDETFSRSNIGSLLDHVNQFAGEEKEKEKKEKKEKKKLQVNILTMDDLSLNLFVAGRKILPVSLSPGTFGPFGEGEDGLTGPEMIQVLSIEFFSRIAASAKKILFDNLGGALKKGLENLFN